MYDICIQGEIYAVGKIKCGSHDDLMDAVSKGGVTRVTDQGIDFYFFPTINSGTTEMTNQTRQAEREKDSIM